MGNSQTKESRGQHGSRASGSSSPIRPQDPSMPPPESSSRSGLSSRPRGSSRPDFSFLGIGGNNEQDAVSLEQRREIKVEREARKAEKERQTRLKERERSMKEEHVDGGYLVTQGVYVGTEDFNKAIVRQLMIERRLAPFWKGLNDFSDSWAEHQLMAAAQGMPIPPADEVPPELEHRLSRKPVSDNKETSIHNLTLPIPGRSQSYQSDTAGGLSPVNNSLPLPSPLSLQPSSTPGTPLFRARAKTLASLTSSSKNNSQVDVTPRELQLPVDHFVNGQPVEVYLYKDAAECPICFLYYPPYLNTTRCCEQAICSECFVQIKRPDPHPPEHEQPDPNAPPQSAEERQAQEEGLLVSEVATCPYCKQPEFGITYAPPPFRRGLTYASGSQPYQVRSAMSSQTSISSAGLSPGRRRGTSLSANAPEVITTDKVRPDWATKLATARAHAARRSAAATALHTAAYMMNGQTDPRAYGPFSRRTVLRRPTGEAADGPGSSLAALALLAERHASRQEDHGQARPSSFLPPPRQSSSRRTRMDDLEDMMMLEAIRLSLASEEERRKKEEKDAKKDAKKKAKEQKKEDKASRRSTLFGFHTNDSASSMMERSRSNQSSLADEDQDVGKGKSIERRSSPHEGDDVQGDGLSRASRLPDFSFSGTSQESLTSSIPIPTPSEPFKRSHLRQMSNASSAASSVADLGPSSSVAAPGSTPQLNEPMFNFQSLAAIVGEEEKARDSTHIEHADLNGTSTSVEAQPPGQSPPYVQSSGKGPSTNEASNAGEKQTVHPDTLVNGDRHTPQS